MSAVVRRLALGSPLSAEEQHLAGDVEDQPLGRELLECLLYEHLHTAARARLRMDRAKAWSQQYHADFTEREHALARARKHYQVLRELGEVDPLLERMAIYEGIHT